MLFECYPLRLEFTAREPLFFPPGKAANTLRGALGTALDEKLFAPIAAGGPSGLADPPRPFVFRARHLDGCSIQSGEVFHFDLNVFTADIEPFVNAFGALSEQGIGPGRGRIHLDRVRRLAPVCVRLDVRETGRSKLRVEFLTPTELKHEGQIAAEPEFPILLARVRDRISTLRSLYGAGPIEIDFQAIGARAAAIRMARCETRQVEVNRRSSRTGQTHSIGGFTGLAEYEGDLAEFLPWLEAARWTGVGRQCVWGKGEIRLQRL
ncbi:MAG TPA: CRISPR system precrRNA processing endoribonuclease RAMP protein Cas6 [Bryobacteraceae bacterium]|nr:CRISPR system precrRNA processing endoribonuclease RAMP protein Cas6 [Bryobacteraceae bacterium]